MEPIFNDDCGYKNAHKKAISILSLETCPLHLATQSVPISTVTTAYRLPKAETSYFTTGSRG